VDKAVLGDVNEVLAEQPAALPCAARLDVGQERRARAADLAEADAVVGRAVLGRDLLGGLAVPEGPAGRMLGAGEDATSALWTTWLR
jgi:hypothetical protein